MPLAAWMRGALRPWVEQRLFAGEARIGAWVNLAAAREWWDAHQRGQDLNRFLWSLVVLEAWAARHLTGSADVGWSR